MNPLQLLNPARFINAPTRVAASQRHIHPELAPFEVPAGFNWTGGNKNVTGMVITQSTESWHHMHVAFCTDGRPTMGLSVTQCNDFILRDNNGFRPDDPAVYFFPMSPEEQDVLVNKFIKLRQEKYIGKRYVLPGNMQLLSGAAPDLSAPLGRNCMTFSVECAQEARKFLEEKQRRMGKGAQDGFEIKK